MAHKLRKHCKILVAWGDCAVFGGVNTLRNWIPTEEVLRRGYVETESTVNGVIPIHEELPPLLDKVLPVNQVVAGGCVRAGMSALSRRRWPTALTLLQGRLADSSERDDSL